MQQQVNEVLIAQDGDEALLLETQSADLILTDLAMPHVNGYELYQQIKQATDPHLLLIPVILMSGRTLVHLTG